MDQNIANHGAAGSATHRLRGFLAALPDAIATVGLVATGAVLLLQFAFSFVVPGGGPFGWAAWVEDDFFYYVVVARNVLHTGLSTFDGATLTNGYHPLWMAVVIAIGAVFDTQSEGFFLAVFFVQAALILGGVIAFAALARRTLASGFLSPGGAMAAATAYGILGAIIAGQGMEIVLLWPLMPLLLSQLWRLCEAPGAGSPEMESRSDPISGVNPSLIKSERAIHVLDGSAPRFHPKRSRSGVARALVAILLLSATILSRLDAAVVFAPVCIAALAFVIARHGFGATLRLWPAAVGLVPLFAYAGFNLAVFGAIMPVSASAKRLMIDHAAFGPSVEALKSFLEVPNPNYWFSPIGSTLFSLAGLLVVSLSRRRRSFPGAGYLLVGAGALAFYVQNIWGSDWHIWRWYFYPVALVGSVGLGVAVDLAASLLRNGPAPLRSAARWLGAGIAAVLMLAVLKANAYQLNNPPGHNNVLFTRAIPIAAFAHNHPGRYAMGDGAGAVGYLLDQPMTQLEGLVNDRQMLADIKAQGRVRDSLARQHVDYYIGGHAPDTGCLSIREPSQGGARTARMTDAFCSRPVFSDASSWLSASIWDLRTGVD